ncbi:MAG: GldG family protein [Anaerolineales bacterium]|nr:GldG family protein [Anaerolineales bacterium]
MNRSKLASIAWVAGAALLLASLAWYVINQASDLTLQIGVALGFLLLAAAVLLDPQRLRRAFTGRQARYGSNALLLTAAVVGVLAVVNFLAYNNPQSIDLTETQDFSLTPETLLILDQLQEPVQLIGFYTPDSADGRDLTRALFDVYQRNSRGKITYEFTDPRANPVAADHYGVQRDASIVVTVGSASEVLSYPSEEEVTGAILRLTNPEGRKVYFIVGHGERDLDGVDEAGYSQVRQALEAKNYQVDTLSPLSEGSIPQDALALVIAGPSVDLPEAEAKLIEEYLSQGGALVVLAEPSAALAAQSPVEPLGGYLKQKWGVEYQDDLVLDLTSSLPLTAIAAEYGEHPITTRMRNLRSYFPSARSLQLQSAAESPLQPTPLLRTASNSWGETDYASLTEGGDLAFDEGVDFPGPLLLAAAVEDPETGSRLVVIGDSDFAANADFLALGNGDLLVNSIDWAARQEALISLTPKPAISRFVLPPSTQVIGGVFLITIILIPAAVLAAGTYVWWSRRRRG